MGEAKRRKGQAGPAMEQERGVDGTYLEKVADAARQAIWEAVWTDMRLPELCEALLATTAYFIASHTRLDEPERARGFAEVASANISDQISRFREKHARDGLLAQFDLSTGQEEFDLAYYGKVAAAVRQAVLNASPSHDGGSSVKPLEIAKALLAVLAYLSSISQDLGTPETRQAFAEGCAWKLVEMMGRAQAANVGPCYRFLQ
jgi:hypothetical protein